MPDYDELDLLSALGGNNTVAEVVLKKEKTEEVIPEVIVIEPKDNSKSECLRQITNILGEYDGLESNIPVTHEYWRLINRYRVM